MYNVMNFPRVLSKAGVDCVPTAANANIDCLFTVESFCDTDGDGEVDEKRRGVGITLCTPEKPCGDPKDPDKAQGTPSKCDCDCDDSGGGHYEIVNAEIYTKSFIADFMSLASKKKSPGKADVNAMLLNGLSSTVWNTIPDNVSSDTCGKIGSGGPGGTSQISPSFCPQGAGSPPDAGGLWSYAHELMFMILKKFDVKENPIQPAAGCEGSPECFRLKTVKQMSALVDTKTGKVVSFYHPKVEFDGGKEPITINVENELGSLFGQLDIGDYNVEFTPLTLETTLQKTADTNLPVNNGQTLQFKYGIQGRPHLAIDVILDIVSDFSGYTAWKRTGCSWIWHEVEGTFSVGTNAQGELEAQVTTTMKGSGFPTHRQWINKSNTPWSPEAVASQSDVVHEKAQGAVTNLWICGDDPLIAE